jgi:eukaryotic-like serine/threonine-protein kinase
MAAEIDRHLLFGLLALQVGLIDQGQLVAAFHAWTRGKARPLADHLQALGHLDADQRSLIEALAAQHLKKHGGDAEQSLAVMPAGHSTRESLARLDDPEIESRLVHLGSAGTQHEGDADRTATYSVGRATSDGQRFLVLRPHARGGLGAVFVALDQELHHEVALKHILDQHADDPTSRQRFLVEAEITGGLEHPGIVPIYGLGTYADGRPYYAMRFIRGDSLKEAIAQFHGDEAVKRDAGRQSLELHKLLRRFLDVCNAIEYAHARGVLHRDIKPGNIIVGKHGETLVVDWGLAKARGSAGAAGSPDERPLTPSSASGSAETLPGRALGTPAYMSPEQARGDMEQLGPRSDVYGLGATLYCVLTGRPPFEDGDIGAILTAVQRGEFVPPHQVNPNLDRALDAVCIKAMALQPEARYSTPKTLAEDIERWMADEPVSAWREPASRRARRWARRNRTAVTSAAVAVIAGIIGLSAVLAVESRANAALKTANSDLAIANAKVSKANLDLHAANAREHQRFDLAMKAIKVFHGEVSADLLLKEKQFEQLRNKLLRGAADFYGELERLLQGQSDLASHAALGRAYDELGELTAKIGNVPEALTVHRKALAVRRGLAAASSSDSGAAVDVARSLVAIGRLRAETGEPTGALSSYDEASSLLGRLAGPGTMIDSIRGENARVEYWRGSALYQIGRRQEALAAFERARSVLVALAAAHPKVVDYHRLLSWCDNDTGNLLTDEGNTPGALTAYERSLQTKQRIAEDHSDVAEYQRDLAIAIQNIANVYSQTGKLNEALVKYDLARVIRQRVATDNPAVTLLQRDLAGSYQAIGVFLSQTGRLAEALAANQRSLAIHHELAAGNPAVTDFQADLTRSYRLLGRLLEQTARPDEALAAFEHARRILERLVVANPGVTQFQSDLASSHLGTGWLLYLTHRQTDALAAYDQARTVYQTLIEAHPNYLGYRDDLANVLTNMAEIHRLRRDLMRAKEFCDRALRIRHALVQADPATTSYRSGLAESLLRSGQARKSSGDCAGAVKDWRHAISLYQSLPARAGEVAFFEACCHASLAGIAGLNDTKVPTPDGSCESDLGMEILRRAVAAGYHDADLIRTDAALDPIRSRSNFQVLMMDLAMPTDPFVRAG